MIVRSSKTVRSKLFRFGGGMASYEPGAGSQVFSDWPNAAVTMSVFSVIVDQGKKTSDVHGRGWPVINHTVRRGE